MQKRRILGPWQAMLSGHAPGRKRHQPHPGAADEGDAMGLCVDRTKGSALQVTALGLSLMGALIGGLGASAAAASPRALAGPSLAERAAADRAGGAMAGITLANAFS